MPGKQKTEQKMFKCSKKPGYCCPYLLLVSEAGMLLKINGMGKGPLAVRAKTAHVEENELFTWRVAARRPGGSHECT